jgi:hypothetical protein
MGGDIEDFFGQLEYIFSICPRISGTLERFFHVAWDFGQANIFCSTFVIYPNCWAT